MTKVFIIAGIIIAFIVLGGLYLNSVGNDKNLFAGVLENASVSKNAKNNAAVKLENYGLAPDFVGIHKWLNSDALNIADLKGKVVLVDFWTYSCINCIRTLPYVTRWHDTYKDQGLVVVGVHTPEFAFEKETKNVRDAIQRHKINYPVAQDNDYATWQAYQNRYWPAHYLIDQNGHIVYYHFGEGQYRETENAIRQLLGLDANADKDEAQTPRQALTPEIYFGLARLEYFASPQYAAGGAQVYTFPSDLPVNRFALSGTWEFDKEKVFLIKSGGRIRLQYAAAEVNMVAKSERPVKVRVILDGKAVGEVEVSDSKLYNLIKLEETSEHALELYIPDPGFEIFTFTFG